MNAFVNCLGIKNGDCERIQIRCHLETTDVICLSVHCSRAFSVIASNHTVAVRSSDVVSYCDAELLNGLIYCVVCLLFVSSDDWS